MLFNLYSDKTFKDALCEQEFGVKTNKESVTNSQYTVEQSTLTFFNAEVDVDTNVLKLCILNCV